MCGLLSTGMVMERIWLIGIGILIGVGGMTLFGMVEKETVEPAAIESKQCLKMDLQGNIVSRGPCDPNRPARRCFKVDLQGKIIGECDR